MGKIYVSFGVDKCSKKKTSKIELLPVPPPKVVISGNILPLAKLLSFYDMTQSMQWCFGCEFSFDSCLMS